jgi:hypothetical protein
MPSQSTLIWFAIEIDRDFYYNSYGEGKPRLYFNTDRYVVIESATYDRSDNVLTVTDKKGDIHILNTEPDHQLFKDTIYKDWEIFDQRTFYKGSDMEDRSDYEPWMYNSLAALAYELKAYDEFTGKMYFGKDIKVN